MIEIKILLTVLTAVVLFWVFRRFYLNSQVRFSRDNVDHSMPGQHCDSPMNPILTRDRIKVAGNWHIAPAVADAIRHNRFRPVLRHRYGSHWLLRFRDADFNVVVLFQCDASGLVSEVLLPWSGRPRDREIVKRALNCRILSYKEQRRHYDLSK